MRAFAIILLVGLIASVAACTWLIFLLGLDAAGSWICISVYQNSLRTPLFSGFLTVGSFLLTLKTAILLRIKDIYDDPEYEIKWENYVTQEKSANPEKPAPKYYEPFTNLGIAMMANVVFAMLTAFLQVSVGFVPNPFAVGICLGFAITTTALLLFLWYLISSNLMSWFATLEAKRIREKNEKLAKAGTPVAPN